ncbi:hypothetical protein GCM10018793_61910 [Streptomyces sulfonofaciens]|uniref:Uncharacterized protein n=1 Tax=Streptomyces sulfonofaciens TaxID=68272 RepID=A0A919GN60_9ACTN|nr:hypothetical protein [Streptomyces sulfonofaciens]GHH87153.1 hypothetical protein GCM10018793_61910 [Streptomyces sulfonofaciens]
MTAVRGSVQFTDAGEAADLAAFLMRLLHYDRAAAVRVQVSGTTLAVFGRPPSFEVLAIRTARLAKPYEHGLDEVLDTTVSAGDLLEAIDERAATAVVPEAVTGPPWAGVLPPRGGWRPEPGLPAPRALTGLVAGVVAEFRTRSEELGEERRTRAELDRIGQDIWSRPVGDTDLPVRAAHAAHALGFLRAPAPRPEAAVPGRRTRADSPGGPDDRGGTGGPGSTGKGAGPGGRGSSAPGTPAAPDTPAAPGTSVAPGASGAAAAPGAPVPVTLLAAGAWLRLRTPYGSIAVRRTGAGTGMLSVTPA